MLGGHQLDPGLGLGPSQPTLQVRGPGHWETGWPIQSVEVCRTLCPGQTLDPSLWLALLTEGLVVLLGAVGKCHLVIGS